MDRRSTRIFSLKASQMCVVHNGFVVNAQAKRSSKTLNTKPDRTLSERLVFIYRWFESGDNSKENQQEEREDDGKDNCSSTENEKDFENYIY